MYHLIHPPLALILKTIAIFFVKSFDSFLSTDNSIKPNQSVKLRQFFSISYLKGEFTFFDIVIFFSFPT